MEATVTIIVAEAIVISYGTCNNTKHNECAVNLCTLCNYKNVSINNASSVKERHREVFFACCLNCSLVYNIYSETGRVCV